jgi:hypothetical protein
MLGVGLSSAMLGVELSSAMLGVELSSAMLGVELSSAMLGVGLSSADQRNIADTARQYCLGSAADSPTRSPHLSARN